jgi:hypothetical protein
VPPSFIPRTDIDLLYRDVCKRPGGPRARLDWAAHDDAVELIASAFARSIEQLAGYDNHLEPLRDLTARAPAEADDVRSTFSVALRLEAQKRLQPADDESLAYRYVERDVVPQRTSGGARFDDPRQEVADGPENSAMKIDLLLESDDGYPAPGEIKIRHDKDPLCALVQTLAAAALLSTEPQRERLDVHHGLRADGRLDAVILLVDFPDDELMVEANERARELAEALVAAPRVGDVVRRIVAFEATADATLAGGALTAEVGWRADAVAVG